MAPPAPGMGGLDIETPRGTVKINADKAGAINVDNDLLKTKLKMEGFTAMSEISLSLTHIKGHQCVNEKCAFTSVFAIFTCPKCDTPNDHLKDKD
jgi:hypothetical protein